MFGHRWPVAATKLAVEFHSASAPHCARSNLVYPSLSRKIIDFSGHPSFLCFGQGDNPTYRNVLLYYIIWEISNGIEIAGSTAPTISTEPSL